MKKFLAVLVLAVLVLTLVSCGGEKADYTFENINEEFVLLSEAVVPSTLPVPYKTDEGFYEEITGKGVLFGDKESEITLKSTDGMSVNLVIDNAQCILFAEGLEGAQIVDIDTSDNFHELAIYSAGPSMDPTINFIRYDGEKITPLHFLNEADMMTSYVPTSMYGYHAGTEDVAEPTYGAVYTNKKGKLLNSMQYTGFSAPKFALSYYELKGESFEEKVLSKDNLPLPVTVKASGNFHAFFTPMETAPESFEDPALFNNFENPEEIAKDTEIKILDYGKCYNYYAFFVEFEGKTGVITFWTGD